MYKIGKHLYQPFNKEKSYLSKPVKYLAIAALTLGLGAGIYSGLNKLSETKTKEGLNRLEKAITCFDNSPKTLKQCYLEQKTK